MTRQEELDIVKNATDEELAALRNPANKNIPQRKDAICESVYRGIKDTYPGARHTINGLHVSPVVEGEFPDTRIPLRIIEECKAYNFRGTGKLRVTLSTHVGYRSSTQQFPEGKAGVSVDKLIPAVIQWLKREIGSIKLHLENTEAKTESGKLVADLAFAVQDHVTSGNYRHIDSPRYNEFVASHISVEASTNPGKVFVRFSDSVTPAFAQDLIKFMARKYLEEK